MTPSVCISQYWHDENVPDYVTDLCGTFQAMNPSMETTLFSHTAAENFIAAHLGPRELEAFRRCAVPAMQADYFRYCAVFVLGGVYADVDYRCNGPLDRWLDQIEAGELFSSPTMHRVAGRDARRVWNGLFAFRESGHPFLGLALEIATANMEERLAETLWPEGDRVPQTVWMTVGSGVLTFMRLLYEWGSFDAVLTGFSDTLAEPFAKLNCEVVESYDRIVDAFTGVHLAPNEEMFRWVSNPDWHLPYKDTKSHWQNADVAFFTPE